MLSINSFKLFFNIDGIQTTYIHRCIFVRNSKIVKKTKKTKLKHFTVKSFTIATFL